MLETTNEHWELFGGGGPNFLRCTTKDKKDLVFNGVFFLYYILIPININESNCVK